MIEPGQDPAAKAGEGHDEILEDLQPREEESAELKAGVVKWGPNNKNPNQ
jgi:hypothetical protein